MIQEKCPYVEKCGACHMGQTTYEEELAKSFKISVFRGEQYEIIL